MSDQPWKSRNDELIHPNAPEGAGGYGLFKDANHLGTMLDASSSTPHPHSPDGRNQSYVVVRLNDSSNPIVDGLEFKKDDSPPYSVMADTVFDFVTNCNLAMKNGGVIGHLQATINYEVETDPKGRVSKLQMIVETSVVRPRWGGGRASDKDRELILKAVGLIEKHEASHRKILENQVKELFRTMHGTPSDKLKEFIIKWEDDVLVKAQKELDKNEGELFLVFGTSAGNAGPATDVKLGPLKIEEGKSG